MVALASFLPFLTPTRPPAALELRDKLVAGVRDGAVIAPLADECAAAKVPFRADLLGDGELWRAQSVVRGEIPRWERNAKLLPFLSNRAGQAYTLQGGGGAVVNYGEVLGRGLYFRAEGTFTPARTSSGNRCPQDFDVAISSGGFVLAGQRIDLPICASHGLEDTRAFYVVSAFCALLPHASLATPVTQSSVDRNALPQRARASCAACTLTKTSGSSRAQRSRPTNGRRRASSWCKCATGYSTTQSTASCDDGCVGFRRQRIERQPTTVVC